MKCRGGKCLSINKYILYAKCTEIYLLNLASFLNEQANVTGANDKGMSAHSDTVKSTVIICIHTQCTGLFEGIISI